jgi:hypothetical protein
MASDASSITLRITGLGHTLTLKFSSSTTIGCLKQEIASHTKLPAVYQRLLARGSKLESDTVTLEDAGLMDRTRIMLLHNALYAQEKEGFEALSALAKEIEDLAQTKDSISSTAMSEMVTRICCKLDEVDTKGSENLRSQRKELIRKAESMEASLKIDEGAAK